VRPYSSGKGCECSGQAARAMTLEVQFFSPQLTVLLIDFYGMISLIYRDISVSYSKEKMFQNTK
jgi:hypothetical protein